MKIRPMGSELFHAERRPDGRRDMTKLVATFRSFVKAPKIEAVGSSKILLSWYQTTRRHVP